MAQDVRVTARQRAILIAIVERYIASGEPVGSATVAAAFGGANLSPATVRNEMGALTEAGLLEQPHTSAGRVPTAGAFRMYVEALGGRQAPGSAPGQISLETRAQIDARFADVAGMQAVLARTSHVLATLSSGVGVAIASVSGVSEIDQLEHVHFSRLGARRVLAVVVTRGGLVRDRVLSLATDPTLGELETAANFLNENFRGWELERVRAELRARVENERREYQRLLNSVEQLWTMAVPGGESAAPAVFVEGVANLVGAHPIGGADDRERLRVLLLALETKQRLVDLLTAYVDARQESVRVVFDLEEQAPEMAGLVLIAAPARIGRDYAVGTVGVLGPQRMQYERAMDAVGYVAQVLERQALRG